MQGVLLSVGPSLAFHPQELQSNTQHKAAKSQNYSQSRDWTLGCLKEQVAEKQSKGMGGYRSSYLCILTFCCKESNPVSGRDLWGWVSLLIVTPLLTISSVLTKTWHLLHLAKQVPGTDEEETALFPLVGVKVKTTSETRLRSHVSSRRRKTSEER